MKTKLFQLGVTIQTIIVLIVNYLAAEGLINNRDTRVISDTYPTILTPSGYAFSIWGLIYLGMVVFSIYQALPGQAKNRLLEPVRLNYIALCAANVGWIFAWHYELIPISLVLIIFMLIFLARISFAVWEVESSADKWFVRVPFAVYFGWITVAAFLNAAVALAHGGFTMSAGTSSAIGVLVIAIVTCLGIAIRFKINSMAYALTIAWGVTAIGIKQSGNTAIVLAAAISMMALIFFALWGYVKDR